MKSDTADFSALFNQGFTSLVGKEVYFTDKCTESSWVGKKGEIVAVLPSGSALIAFTEPQGWAGFIVNTAFVGRERRCCIRLTRFVPPDGDMNGD